MPDQRLKKEGNPTVSNAGDARNDFPICVLRLFQTPDRDGSSLPGVILFHDDSFLADDTPYSITLLSMTSSTVITDDQ
jgi:hypothetical protein